MDTTAIEAFGPAIRRITARIPTDESIRAALSKDGLQVLRDHGAPVDTLPPATRAELHDYLSNVTLDSTFSSGLGCAACEWGLGVALVVAGGAALIAAGVAFASGGWAVTGITGIIVGAGFVIAEATVSTILVGLASVGTSVGGLLLGEFIPKVCAAVGACSESAETPLDPEIGKWVGQDVLTIGAGTNALVSSIPPAQCVFNHVLYLVSGAATGFGVPTMCLASLDITSGPAWAGGSSFAPNLNPPAIVQPAMASGTVGTGSAARLYLIFYDSSAALNWTSFDGTNWSAPAPIVIGGQPVTDPTGLVTAAVVFGKLYVCYNSSGSIGLLSYDGTSWSSPGPLLAGGSAIGTNVTPALVNYSSGAYLLYCDSHSKKISYTRQTSAGAAWTAPTVIQAKGRGSMQTTLGLSACAYAGKLYMMFQSYHHSFLYWVTYDGAAWLASQLQEPYLSSDNKAKQENVTTEKPFSLAASDEDQRLFLAYLADDNTGQVHWTIG